MWHGWKMVAFQKTFYMANWRQGKTNRTTPTTLQGHMQTRHSRAWHKHILLGSSCHRQKCLETVKLGLSQYEETQRVKAKEKKLHKKTVCLASRPATSFTCFNCGRDYHSRIGLHSHNRRCTMGANLWSHETERCQWYTSLRNIRSHLLSPFSW